MKNLSNNLTKFYMCFVFSILAVGFSSCSSDDDVRTVVPPQATGTITASDQTISGNTIVVDRIVVGQDSWVVVRNSGEEQNADIVSEPVFLEQGTHEDVELPLTNTANLSGNVDGDDFVITLHVDDQSRGTRGQFDYDGASGVDDRIRSTTGQEVSQTIRATGPSISADDNQMVTENNEVTFSNINTSRDGWVALYGQNEDGTMNEDDLIGSGFVEAGQHQDFRVAFNEGYVHTPGQTIFPRLHYDDPADGTFSYTMGGTEDMPETYGWDDTTGMGRNVQNTGTANTSGGFTLQ